MKVKIINIPLVEFTRRIMQAGGISLKGVLKLPVYYVQLLVALPFSLLQWLIFNSRIQKTTITHDPVFILGHYRSGTTYLQKLIASDPQFGVLTNYDVILPNANLLFGQKMRRFIQWIIILLKIKNPFFHNTIFRLNEPAEEDDFLMNKASPYSAYWGLVFPRRWRQWLNGEFQMADKDFKEGWKKEYFKALRYITYKSGGKQLILKSPPNTERIRWLLEMFPQAKFIYLSRDPVTLYYSMQNMWRKAILNYFSLQHVTDQELDDIIFGHYEYLTGAYQNDRHLIPEGHLIEVTYEALQKDPLEIIRTIYSNLNLHGVEHAIEKIKTTIQAERDYHVFEHPYNEATTARIHARWGIHIQEHSQVLVPPATQS